MRNSHHYIHWHPLISVPIYIMLTYCNSSDPIAYNTENEQVIYYSSESQGDNIRDAIGTFEVIPNINKGFESIYVFGASGSGKSYFSSEYALSYRRLFPNNKIYFFSQKTNDDSYTSHISNDGKRIRIDDILNMVYIDIVKFAQSDVNVIRDFRNCLMIFDDILYFDDRNTIEKVCRAVIQVLTLGRSNHIYCVITAHLIYQIKNRDLYMNIQNEVHKIVWFKGVNVFQLTYCLMNYWGFTKKQIRDMIKIDDTSRYTLLNRYPSYILTRHAITII